jgi:protein TonB
VKRERTLAERRVLERLENFLDAAQREAARAAVTTETSRVAVKTPRRPRHRAAVWIVVMVAAALGAVLYFSPPPGHWDQSSATAPVTTARRDAAPARSGAERSTDPPSPVSESVPPDAAQAGAAPEPASPEPGQPSAAQSPVSPPVTPRQTQPPAAEPVPTANVAREDQPPEPVESLEGDETVEPVVRTDPPPLAAASITPPPTAALDETLPDEPAAVAAPESSPPDDWTGRLVDLASVDVPPRPTRRDLPRYTKRARRLRHQGVVALELLVSETGQVVEARSLESIPDSDLDQAALEVARTWLFTPALKAGDPVRVWMPVEIEFSVSSGKATKIRVRD